MSGHNHCRETQRSKIVSDVRETEYKRITQKHRTMVFYTVLYVIDFAQRMNRNYKMMYEISSPLFHVQLSFVIVKTCPIIPSTVQSLVHETPVTRSLIDMHIPQYFMHH